MRADRADQTLRIAAIGELVLRPVRPDAADRLADLVEATALG